MCVIFAQIIRFRYKIPKLNLAHPACLFCFYKLAQFFGTPYIYQILTDLLNYFTVRIRKKYIVTRKCVAKPSV